MKISLYIFHMVTLCFAISSASAQTRKYDQGYQYFTTIDQVELSYKWWSSGYETGHWLTLQVKNKSNKKVEISGNLIFTNKRTGQTRLTTSVYANLKPGETSSSGMATSFSEGLEVKSNNPPDVTFRCKCKVEVQNP